MALHQVEVDLGEEGHIVCSLGNIYTVGSHDLTCPIPRGSLMNRIVSLLHVGGHKARKLPWYGG